MLFHQRFQYEISNLCRKTLFLKMLFQGLVEEMGISEESLECQRKKEEGR